MKRVRPRLCKSLKDKLLFFFRHPQSGVHHARFDDRRFGTARFGNGSRSHGDLARGGSFGEFNGVGEEVHEDLGDTIWIRM